MNTFYKVPEEAWMFRHQAKARPESDRKWTPREEFVRQWCIQELIRTYGVRIDCIEIEKRVRVARERRPHSADIVILQNGTPYVVVECKSQRVKKLDSGINQAINYASIPDIGATFAVCTNGLDWLVRRKINDQWVPVVDIPSFRDGQPDVEWSQILVGIRCLSPILYWLDRRVPARSAANYFSALQVFFYSRNEVTLATDRSLLWAADNLLRVMALLHNHKGYLMGKMQEVCNGLNEYWKQKGVKSDFGGENLRDVAFYGYAELSALLEDNKGLSSLDMPLLRIILSLFGYLRGLRLTKRVSYTEVGDEIQREVRAYLDMALTMRFNSFLPDSLDDILVTDIHDSCKPAWKQFLKDH